MKREGGASGYHIHRFMRELGLSGNELYVYALIYSYTSGEVGMYYGKRQYFADTLGISLRTLSRMLSSLFARGYIEKTVSPDGLYKGIRCVEFSRIKEAERVESSEKSERSASLPTDSNARVGACDVNNVEKGDGAHLSFWTEEKREAAYRRIIANRFGKVSPDEEKMLIEEYKEKGVNAKSSFLHLGIGGRVLVTEEQYKALAERIGANRLHGYIERLDHMLFRNETNGMQCQRPHYKVIKKWIEDDLRA